MQLSIIPIGNSQGLRLSKSLLKQYNIKDKVELIFKEGYIIIKPISKPREGWEEAFKQMHENADDELLMNDVFEDDHFEDWKWE